MPPLPVSPEVCLSLQPVIDTAWYPSQIGLFKSATVPEWQQSARMMTFVSEWTLDVTSWAKSSSLNQQLGEVCPFSSTKQKASSWPSSSSPSWSGKLAPCPA